ncbi:hypothetical protein DID88_001233 [Monilinia fructigena]|uniref:Uncharacterized protein n=1 Tax=Monilinia fructigena TaxID=38457 RepID=A0A395IXY0_9HELO|nr:hypothetical protein DID88_001233 [Monilinia fructigena]
MDSMNKNKSSLAPATSTPQIPPRKVASQTDTPTTPPNLYPLSPPRAPRAQRFRRIKEILTGSGQPSTPSHTLNMIHNRLVGLGTICEAGSPKCSSSQSPRDCLRSYRSRSPLGSHHQIRRSTEVEFGSLLIKPGSQGFSTVLAREGNQGTPIPNDKPSDQLDIGARYRKMLSLDDSEYDESMAGSSSTRIPNDENEDVKYLEKDLDDLYKIAKPFRYDERGSQ